MRILYIGLIVFLGACATETDKKNDALVKKHNEIWDLMGLSRSARDELNGIVIAVNTQIMKNKAERPEMMKELSDVKRAEKLTHEQYIAKHKKRFDGLKISEPTQKELFAAAEFVWKALHSTGEDFTDEQRKTAQTIQNMMRELNGPPPCCDDNIFKRASKP